MRDGVNSFEAAGPWIARIHCPEIVKHIEKERQKSLVEAG
jgi:hypothetical protein